MTDSLCNLLSRLHPDVARAFASCERKKSRAIFGYQCVIRQNLLCNISKSALPRSGMSIARHV